MTTTVAVRSYKMADCPPAEAIDQEQSRWSMFGTCGQTVADGQTGFVITEVTVASRRALEALRGAVNRSASSKLVSRQEAPGA